MLRGKAARDRVRDIEQQSSASRVQALLRGRAVRRQMKIMQQREGGKNLFACTVEQAAERSDPDGDPPCPSVISICSNWLMQNGLDEEGLFRVPGDHADAQAYRDRFDS